MDLMGETIELKLVMGKGRRNRPGLVWNVVESNFSAITHHGRGGTEFFPSRSVQINFQDEGFSTS